MDMDELNIMVGGFSLVLGAIIWARKSILICCFVRLTLTSEERRGRGEEGQGTSTLWLKMYSPDMWLK
jgi:hypothetical protein